MPGTSLLDRSGPTIPVQIVAAGHPSLGGRVDTFLDELRAEPRFFGPSASLDPKPFPSLLSGLADRDGIRFCALDGRRVVALARVAPDGELLLAVVADRRHGGIGTALAAAIVERARALGHRRLVMRSSRRSRAARALGDELGCRVVDVGRGHVEVLFDLDDTRSA